MELGYLEKFSKKSETERIFLLTFTNQVSNNKIFRNFKNFLKNNKFRSNKKMMEKNLRKMLKFNK